MTQHGLDILSIHIFFGMCVHEIQFPCKHSTVIYTSIAILHSWFCKNARYPDGFARGGGMVSETHQCYAPIHSMRLCGLRCGKHMQSVCWNTMVCIPVYHGVPENYSTKKLTQEMQFILLRLRAYVYSWSKYVHPFVWSWHVVVRIWSITGVFCFHIYHFYRPCAADECTWTCGDMQLYDNSAGYKRAASPWRTLSIRSCRTFCSNLAW